MLAEWKQIYINGLDTSRWAAAVNKLKRAGSEFIQMDRRTFIPIYVSDAKETCRTTSRSH